jgi:hypothetical protein
MTGPQHYAEAERLAGAVKDKDLPAEAVEATATLAHVHATLALVAVYADVLLGPVGGNWPAVIR